MSKVKIRKYVDIHGKSRELVFHRELPYLVPWLKYREPSSATQWQMEDGSLVQVPDRVWEEYGINFKDEYKK